MILLVAIGCVGGGVVVTGGEPFGDVRSAFWTDTLTADHMALTDAGDLLDMGTVNLPPYLFLWDEPDGCAATRSWYAGWGEASALFLEDIADHGLCAAMPDFLTRLAAVDALYSRPTREIQVSGCGEEWCFVGDTTYEVATDQLGGWFTVTDPARAAGRYERALAAWSTDACGYAPGSQEYPERDAVFVVSEGALVMDPRGGGPISGELSAELVDPTTDEAVALDATFTASLCELPSGLVTVTPGWI